MRNGLCWLASAWFAGTVLAGSPGYLTRLGPAPLRFQPVLAMSTKVVMPPLEMSTPLPVDPGDTNNPTAAAAKPPATNTVSGVTAANNAAANTNSTAAIIAASSGGTNTTAIIVSLDPPAPPAAVPPTADKLVHFFTPVPLGTNGPNVVLPGVIFSPPVPATAPGVSRATYESN